MVPLEDRHMPDYKTSHKRQGHRAPKTRRWEDLDPLRSVPVPSIHMDRPRQPYPFLCKGVTLGICRRCTTAWAARISIPERCIFSLQF
ncbi:hypothetical protein CENSYa_0685 [Cenarchaeum symbiosum A]|uniref:Uncharacterized protein n=1 Tax=Cenarchaeum symbiosum (strain A) TaxID=414004 RepID=A0RVF1_CENSY|nr:hypothetical protein CENSYa_0685 [Cenarchaeum symbiosum A]